MFSLQSMQEGGALKRLRSDGSSLGVQGNGRKLLGAAVLARALANVKRIVPETLWAPFRVRSRAWITQTR